MLAIFVLFSFFTKKKKKKKKNNMVQGVVSPYMSLYVNLET